MNSRKPSDDELHAAIQRHVKRSVKAVAKIRPEHRTILSLAEAQERAKREQR